VSNVQSGTYRRRYRRTLIKSTALGSLALAAGGLSAFQPEQRRCRGARRRSRRGAYRLGRLFGQLRQPLRLRLHVRDDEVYWVETDNTGADIYGDHQVRACLRGRSFAAASIIPTALTIP
jgi:Tat-targeted selenate reductase subunit YnfE